MAKYRKCSFGLVSLLAACCSVFASAACAEATQDLSPPAVSAVPAGPNYGGLWWNAPAGSESGWGINFAHQGDTIYATWFTYDGQGSALWMVMAAYLSPVGGYSGIIYSTTGPSYAAVPFNPNAVTRTVVGTGTLNFSDPNDGTFNYTVNGLNQTKPITREVFGLLPTCVFGAQPNLALATNYQDLWWTPSESGWGISLTQQGSTIYAAWFTYDQDGTPLWLTVTATPTLPIGAYTGALYRSSGPAFYSLPFDPAHVAKTVVGTVTFDFIDGNNATFAYTLFGVTQVKNITREVFLAPGTVCQ